MTAIKGTARYFKAHPLYNSSTHFLGGVGIGILITYPFVGSHPLRWGLLFIGVSLLAHLYPALRKK